MRALKDISLPSGRDEAVYAETFLGQRVSFAGLKKLLAAADYAKAGDRNAGLSARSEFEREAARMLLSQLTLQHLYDRPLLDGRGEIDAVMRVNYDIDAAAFARIADWTVGTLKDFLLAAPVEEVSGIGAALTGVMAAAVAKLMDAHELIFAARKFHKVTRARSTLGLPGTLSSRLQPNHPTDDLRSLTLLIYSGFSLAGGDALIGVNPAVDSKDNVANMLVQMDTVRRQTGAPTQICVLAHVKTQLACLQAGAPVEVMFQSLAGTESTNLTEFDISVDLLDRAYRTMKETGPLAGTAQQFMYFETGQGSEFTYGKHEGTDMTTLEALTYGLARRYDPFMVNNVTGFIGPETHENDFEMLYANLQDHFMGKLLGLPMGMAPCYTLHADIGLEGQQVATELLTTAGANYYMDVYLNTDRMLAYFDTSAHDSQTLRELHGRTPAPEFTDWALERGILARDSSGRVARGKHWGDPEQFAASKASFAELKRATPALYGFENAGPRPSDRVTRTLRLHQAFAREATRAVLNVEWIQGLAEFRCVRTRAGELREHLSRPALGATIDAESLREIRAEDTDIQIVVTDGLSAEAIHANLGDLLPVVREGIATHGYREGMPIVCRYGRVKLAEPLAEALRTRLLLLLVGERPGGDAASARSLSCYFVYQLLGKDEQSAAAAFSGNPGIRFEYTVLSNIYSGGGLPPLEAGSVILEKAAQILSHGAAGNRLTALLKEDAG